MRQHCTRRGTIPDRTNSVRSRSSHNRFPNQNTRTQCKNNLVTSAPNASFPGVKHDQIWSFGHLTTKLQSCLKIIGQMDFTHTPWTPHPVFTSRIERLWTILGRRVIENSISAPDSYTTVICRRVHKTDISRYES